MLRSLREWWTAGWRSLPIVGGLRILTAAFLLVVAVVPVVGNELRVQDVDPVYMRNMVERVAAFGGTYYENSIHNRGPVEPLLYDLAGRVTSYDGYWFAVSAMVALLAGFVGYAAARTARWAGANRSIALGAAAVVYVQLALANHGFSRVLYVRNITTGLLVGVWVLALSERCWSDQRRARRTSIAIGALLGIVVEQLLTSVFAGVAVGLVALLLMYERRGREEGRRHEQAAVVAAVVAFLATPAWYLVRGGLEEYWSGWWVYARHMSTGTGRSFGSQLSLGWDQVYAHHRGSPMVLLLLAFAGTTWLLWRTFDRRARIVHLGLLAWWAAGWVELVLSQRYTPHYYAVTAIPLALMGAALAGHAARAVATRRPASRATLAVPLAATLLAIYLSGPTYFVDALEETRDFRGVAALADERARQLGGGDRSVRAVLDLVSDDRAALLAWTFDPFVYPKYRRVTATRFQWKSLLLGEIYLGLTKPEHVLPNTWRWFAEDLEESDPVAFVETEPFESATPFEDIVRAGFAEVYPGSAATVWLRRDAASTLLDRSADRRWRDPGQPSSSGWTVDDDVARFEETAGAAGALQLGAGPCRRIEGTFDVAASGALVDVTFRFDDPDDPEREPQHLTLEGARVGSGSAGLGPLGFESLDAGVPDDGPVELALVIGDRSAALVVDGALRAAVRLPPSLVRVSLESRTDELTVSGLRVGDAPRAGACRSG
ncbi:MAG: hypothetical protein Q8K58_07545 [Acidimicrobiales bacterium]|nr:hypothetical protein [Acidimicrobiales bacterium]